VFTLIVILAYAGFSVEGFTSQDQCIEGMKIVQKYTPHQDIKLMACIAAGTKI
jgi:hypothetical protein